MLSAYDLYEYRRHDFYTLVSFYGLLGYFRGKWTLPKFVSPNNSHNSSQWMMPFGTFFGRNLSLNGERKSGKQIASHKYFIIITIIVLNDKKPQRVLKNINIYIASIFFMLSAKWKKAREFADEKAYHKNMNCTSAWGP